jgi:hypothetical protein
MKNLFDCSLEECGNQKPSAFSAEGYHRLLQVLMGLGSTTYRMYKYIGQNEKVELRLHIHVSGEGFRTGMNGGSLGDKKSGQQALASFTIRMVISGQQRRITLC